MPPQVQILIYPSASLPTNSGDLICSYYLTLNVKIFHTWGLLQAPSPFHTISFVLNLEKSEVSKLAELAKIRNLDAQHAMNPTATLYKE